MGVPPPGLFVQKSKFSAAKTALFSFKNRDVAGMRGAFFRGVPPDNPQAPVVQKMDNAIHRINHYPVDSVVSFANTYPLDSDLSGG